MGYTHYWYQRPLAQEDWDGFVQDVEKVLGLMHREGPVLAVESDVNRNAEVNQNYIRFNGFMQDGCETFILNRVPARVAMAGSPLPHFACCKTNGRPYDDAVCAVLIVAKRHFGQDIVVKSDGSDTEWADAMDMVDKLLGYGEGFRFRSIDGHGEQLVEV